MSSEGVRISNPKGNNRDFLVSFLGLTCDRKKFATVKPGHSVLCDKKYIIVEEVMRPARITVGRDGSVEPDRGR
jgi:hypothetical protein